MKFLMKMACFLLFVTGCANQALLSNNNTIAEEYLLSKGYEVLSFNGEDVYLFTDKELSSEPHLSTWAVQEVDPNDYMDVEIKIEKFTVKGHPLDKKLYGSEPYYLEETHVQVFIVNEEIIGGTSYPGSKEPLLGNVYSLDGRTVEEMGK